MSVAPDFDHAAPASGWHFHVRPVYSGSNKVTLLRGGDALFPAMCDAIAAARKEVWLATYIFHDDAASGSVVSALVAAAHRGVLVSIVVDGFGAGAGWHALERKLRNADLRVAVFRPLHRWWNWLQPGQLRRLHQKLCVIDAEVAFVGGINLIDDRFDVRLGWNNQPRLDYAVRVHGPVAQTVQHVARAVWTRASLGRAWRDEVSALARSARPLVRAKRLLKKMRTFAPSPRQPPPADTLPMRAALLVRDNLFQRRSIERAYVQAIRNAQHAVDLICPYFYPGNAFRRALRGAAARGVRVRLLMQGRWDYRLAELAAYALYDEMLAGGVQIYEYTPAHLHAKVAVIDHDWATVGSSNIDPLSLLLNLEANVVVRDREFAAELRQEFETVLATSTAIDHANRDGRSMSFLRRGFIASVARLYLRIAGATGRY